MNIRPFNFSTRIRPIVSSILLVLIFSLFTASAQACHKGTPHKKDPPDACDQSETIVPDNDVLWGDDVLTSGFLEMSTRLCTSSQIAPDESSGAYTCELGTDLFPLEGYVTYALNNMSSVPVHRRGDDWRCTSGFISAEIDPDLEYSFSWAGDCTDDIEGCEVTVVNAFNNPWAMGNSVERFTLEAYGKITESATNPFSVPQSLTIDYVHLTLFAQKGKDKVLAICKLMPNVGYPVTFVTSPVE